MSPLADLRFRHAKRASELLGQVSTPDAIVERLLEDFSRSSRCVVDLGAGDGRLARAALARAPQADAHLFEVDEARVQLLRETAGPRECVWSFDVLRDPGLLAVPGMRVAPDAVVSNPPYQEVNLVEGDLARARAILPFLVDQSGWVRADVVFVAYAWAMCGLGAFLGLILPAPALTLPQYRPLRELFLSQLENLTVSQLPSRCFPGVEVDAFLVTGRRALPARRNPTLRLISRAGDVVAVRQVSYEMGLERLDFAAQEGAARLRLQTGPTDTLHSLGVEIIRGSMTRVAFERAGLPVFHTTDFAAAGAELHFTDTPSTHRVAAPGDILIPRVGTRCLMREARVASGSGVFSDCVYRLRGSPEVMHRVWATLASDFGRQWRATHAVGSCAKHLPLWVLRDLPVL